MTGLCTLMTGDQDSPHFGRSMDGHERRGCGDQAIEDYRDPTTHGLLEDPHEACQLKPPKRAQEGGGVSVASVTSKRARNNGLLVCARRGSHAGSSTHDLGGITVQQG